MFNLHLADIHSSDPVLDDATDKKGDTASIPRENPVDDAIDEKGGTASIPRETPP
jgi:DNA-directed RNA polymerase subunit H (RpoH/RPB5)